MSMVLVTGGAGFIGSNLVAALLEQGHRVVAYDSLITGREENIGEFAGEENFSFVRGDILDFERLAEAMRDVEIVLHQAALPSVARSVADPVTTNRINVEGTINVLLAAREAGVERVVIASSSSVYGDTPQLPKREDMPLNPKSPYAVSKAAKEMYARVFSELYGISTICLRYFNVYGPKQDPKSEYAAVIPRFITSALEGRALTVHGDGKQTRDFTFVEDVVQANLLAMDSRTQGNYNIAFGKNVSILELAEMIIELTDSSSEIIHTEPRRGDVRHSLADITKAK
ncbi:MAG: SDR family oxidoreductase, partial [Euryarchaeota archaeon]|nr:SDR family oxidoreductase [Euryarchaeota archaeon]